ncbi:MAG: glycerophosphodiester phosphodiesterase [Deltaproteobacteria bacterium]|nr:MAG: glycerophosphodiester phosphodiesterase [Deltaproteobacteria bacterium]
MFFDLLPKAGYVCAHRGARALTPENTMLAARQALAVAADFWEMDVQRSVDGTLIAFHDDTLGRTTDVTDRPAFASRSPWRTSQFTFDELQLLDAGSWFVAQDPFGTIARGELLPEEIALVRKQRIPALKEILAFTREHDFPVNIEIKDQIHAPDDLTIVAQVLEAVRAAGAEELVLISSFNHEYLKEMRRLSPEMPLAALVEGAHPENLVEYLKQLDVAGYHPEATIIDEALVRDLTAQGFHVSCFTVNDMEQAMSFIDAGCYAVITDYPHALRQRLLHL